MHQHGGDCQSDDDSERDAPVVADEKVVPEHREGAQRADHDASTGAAEVAADRARTARSRATASSENATNTASRTRIAASEPGQRTPAPSPPQNVPKVVSSAPTANFVVFSGTRASGARTATPAMTTASTAAAAPRTANPMLPWLAAKVTTMKATSSPSSTTALNDKVNAYQSGTANRRRHLPGIDARLVVQLLQPGRPQDRLTQPLQSENQQQGTHH